MMLYMALLVFLLLVVLYQVYRMTEYFTAAETQAQTQAQAQTQILPIFAPTANTKMSEGTEFLRKLGEIISSLQRRVNTLPDTVTDSSLTNDEMKAFEFISNPDPDPKHPGASVIEMPARGDDMTHKYFNTQTAKKFVADRLSSDSKQLADLVEMVTKTSAEKAIMPSETISSAVTKMYGNSQIVSSVLSTFPAMYAKAQVMYGFYDKFIKRNSNETVAPVVDLPAPAAFTASVDPTTATAPVTAPMTTQTTTDTTTIANSINNINMGSMLSAIGPIRSASAAGGSETTDQITIVPNSTPATAPVHDISEETEKRLVNSIMKQIKDKNLLDRSLDNPQDSSYSNTHNNYSSTSTEQGSEWKHTKPDMSKYIRKDSIPCWNCSP